MFKGQEILLLVGTMFFVVVRVAITENIRALCACSKKVEVCATIHQTSMCRLLACIPGAKGC